MIKFFEDTFAPTFRYLTNKKYRAYVNLHFQFQGVKRFTQKNLTFLGYSFTVIDVPSFLEHYRSIIFEEMYKFESESQKPLIYDCGANIGMSVLYFKMLYPESTIKAFEADPAIAKILQQNISKNKLRGIEVIDKAVWKDNMGIEFGQEGADAGSIYNTGAKVKIPSLRLKELIEKEGRIDFLKIDIEGAEIEVLSDCKDVLLKVNKLFVEYHSYNGMKQELDVLLKILTDAGFRYFIQGGNFRKYPFIYEKGNDTMDLLLNISAYR